MRIGIEAQRLFRTHKHGMDRVALELIKNLQKIDTVNEYFIFVKPDEDNTVIKPTSNFKIIEIPGSSYPIWEQIKLPKFTKAYKCDVLHCTSNTAPLFGNIQVITTLHDIIYMEGNLLDLISSDASPYQKFGNLYRRLIVSNVVKRSKRLITVSNFEKHNISHFFKMNPGQLETIYNGVGLHFTTNINAEKLTEVKLKFHLPNDYFLHLANKDPRKNTKNVIKGFIQFLKQSSAATHFKLVLLGYSNVELKTTLTEINAIAFMNQIVLLSYVDDQDLPAIYRLSRLFLFPSLREGFGIPIIEAMACGVPVITSNSSSMPEVAGNAAHLINPMEVDQLVDGMHKLIEDDHYRNELIAKGRKRSKQFTWNTMASKVLKIYKELNTSLKN